MNTLFYHCLTEGSLMLTRLFISVEKVKDEGGCEEFGEVDESWVSSIKHWKWNG